MPWKVGGNFETVVVTCETNWKECLIAIVNYLWDEVVSDVVDYLAKEGIIWILVIAVASTLFFIRIKYCKNMHTKNMILNKQILNKVGYKIQDLELKVNVLTYKMQYGTWPLPHQIYNLSPKLRKIRLTLSNPGDRKNWLKHVLLNSPSENNIYAPYLNALHSSRTKLTNNFNTKQEHVSQHAKHSELSTVCSSIESLKSTSGHSMNIYSWKPDVYSQNANVRKNNLSKSRDFTLQRRKPFQLLPLNPNMIDHRASKMISLGENNTCATSTEYNPCEKFTDTVYKCKSFLKELRCNKHLHPQNRSSETSKVSLSKSTHIAKQPDLSTTKKEETFDAPLADIEKISEKKCTEQTKDKIVKDTKERYSPNKVNSFNAVVLKNNNRAFSKELVMQPMHNVQSSQENFYEARRRLESLHNVLQVYQDTNRFSERQGDQSSDQVEQADSFVTHPVMDISSEYFELSSESSSSLAEYSSRTSKTYQHSNENITMRNAYAKEFKQQDIQETIRSSLPIFEQEDRENKCKKSEENISECGNHESKLNPEAKKDAIKSNVCNAQNNISEKIFYILSPENKNISSQNEESLTQKHVTAFDKEHTTSTNSSQNKISTDKSTVSLLQEALYFKNILMRQSKKKYPSNDANQNITDEYLSISNNNLLSMIVDIKEEAPIIGKSSDKINQRYICLEMKQRRDAFPQSLRKINTFVHCKNERDTPNQDCIPETSSEYFSITDLAVHNNAENNVASTSPLYEKVISITIPVNVKNQDEINVNERAVQTKTVLSNLQENTISDNNVIDKRSSTTLKLEDLILERVKNIRDYMNTFLQNQNTAIFKARRALRYQDNIFQCSDEASHVVIYNRSTVPSSSSDQTINSSKRSSDFLTHAWPNYMKECKQETERDETLSKRSSDVYLKRNPGMFALIAPINNKIAHRNDTQQSETSGELKKEETDLSFPTFLTYPCRSDSESIHKIADSITSDCEEHVISNIEYDKIDKETMINLNTDFPKHKRQTQTDESKPSHFPLNVANADAKIIHVAREEHPAKSNCDSISHSNSYFTDEEMTSKSMKIDNVSPKSASSMRHSHAKSNLEKKQDNIKQVSSDKGSNVNSAMPSKLLSDNERSNLTIVIDQLNSNVIKSGHDCLTNKKILPSTILKEKDFLHLDTPLLPFSLSTENKSPDGTSSKNVKCKNDRTNEISADVSPQIKYSTKSYQTYPQVRAKSDISLISNRNKIILHLKKSHSFFMHHNNSENNNALRHTCAKLHNEKNKCIKNKLRLETPSKSIILPRRVSTRSCIPILKNRLESSHRMKHQMQAKSPLKNMHLHVENLIKLSKEKIVDKKLEELEITTCRDNDTSKNSKILSNDQYPESLAIDKNRKDTCGSTSDMNMIQCIEKIASKEVVVISIMANDGLRKKYPADLFILNTKSLNPTTDLLISKNKLWTTNVEKTEKEVTAKPSITDTCTSMSTLK